LNQKNGIVVFRVFFADALASVNCSARVGYSLDDKDPERVATNKCETLLLANGNP